MNQIWLNAVRASGASPVLLANLVSFWSLEEASGSRADAHGSNALADNNTVTNAAGKVGNAASFAAASSEYLSIADNASFTVTSFTWLLWIYTGTLDTTFRFAVTKDTGGANREYGVGKDDSKRAYAFCFNQAGSVVERRSTPALSDNTWYLLEIYYDSVAQLFGLRINDGAVAVQVPVALTAPIRDTSAALNIGRLGSGSGYWNGLVDQVGMWSRVLTTAERTWLYNSGNGRSYAEVAAYTG